MTPEANVHGVKEGTTRTKELATNKKKNSRTRNLSRVTSDPKFISKTENAKNMGQTPVTIILDQK